VVDVVIALAGFYTRRLSENCLGKSLLLKRRGWANFASFDIVHSNSDDEVKTCRTTSVLWPWQLGL
jgi:hypothetical protein